MIGKSFRKSRFQKCDLCESSECKEDPEWSLEDARFSAIVYKPSDVPNASESFNCRS